MSSKVPSKYTYFLMCVFASCHQNVGRPRANTKKVWWPSIHTPLCCGQCVGWRTYPCKVRTSLRARPSDAGGGPTEVNRSVFTWRSYSQHVTTCPTRIKNFISIEWCQKCNILSCMWGQCLQSNGHNVNTHVKDVTVNTNVKKTMCRRSLKVARLVDM